MLFVKISNQHLMLKQNKNTTKSCCLWIVSYAFIGTLKTVTEIVKNEGILGDVKFAIISLQWSLEFSHVPMWFSVKGTNIKKKKKKSCH